MNSHITKYEKIMDSHVTKRKYFELSQNKKKVMDSHITKIKSYKFSCKEMKGYAFSQDKPSNIW